MRSVVTDRPVGKSRGTHYATVEHVARKRPNCGPPKVRIRVWAGRSHCRLLSATDLFSLVLSTPLLVHSFPRASNGTQRYIKNQSAPLCSHRYFAV